MSWWRGFADRIERDAPLGRRTWFRVGGRVRLLFRPRDTDDLAAMLTRARDADVPVKVLGAGANVLVSDDGFDGVVIRLTADSFRRLERRGESLEVGAGVDLMRFARDCSAQGLSGIEGLAGIPGTIGGAIRMNAGGRFGDTADVVDNVTVVGPEGTVERWPRARVGFGYRRSAIADRIVVSARFVLREDDPAQTAERFDACFRSKRASQPMSDRSAGCVFKNPEGRSAGSLIDQAGLKGARSGRASVSDRHANFIVAEPGATASDVLRLIDLVRERVCRVFDVELELEVDIWRPSTERISV